MQLLFLFEHISTHKIKIYLRKSITTGRCAVQSVAATTATSAPSAPPDGRETKPGRCTRAAADLSTGRVMGLHTDEVKLKRNRKNTHSKNANQTINCAWLSKVIKMRQMRKWLGWNEVRVMHGITNECDTRNCIEDWGIRWNVTYCRPQALKMSATRIPPAWTSAA